MKRVILKSLDSYEKHMLCNGCGSQKSVWKWVRPPYGLYFKKICDQHDLDYLQGFMTRMAADDMMKNSMFALIQVDYPKKLKNFFHRRWLFSWCRIYYHGVRGGGEASFRHGKAFNKDEMLEYADKMGS